MAELYVKIDNDKQKEHLEKAIKLTKNKTSKELLRNKFIDLGT
jgi:hypothetical protein